MLMASPPSGHRSGVDGNALLAVPVPVVVWLFRRFFASGLHVSTGGAA
jgi:hypothetical protein